MTASTPHGGLPIFGTTPSIQLRADGGMPASASHGVMPFLGPAPSTQPRVDSGLHRPWVDLGLRVPDGPTRLVDTEPIRSEERADPEPTKVAEVVAVPVNIAISFGSHISQETIEKIVQGDYIDLFSLLNNEIDPATIKYDDQEKERIKKKKPDRSWSNWLPAFYAYAGILAGAKPELGAALFKYADLIYRAYTDFYGPAWLAYDEEFRRKRSKDKSLKWEVRDHDLWLQNMTPSRPSFGFRFDSGHLIQRNSSFPVARQVGAGMSVQPRNVCWEFNSKGACSRRPCRFKHACSICGAGHSAANCNRGRPMGSKSQNNFKRNQPGSGAAAKGTQPS